MGCDDALACLATCGVGRRQTTWGFAVAGVGSAQGVGRGGGGWGGGREGERKRVGIPMITHGGGGGF